MANLNEKKSAQNPEESLNKREAFFMKNKKAILYTVAAIIVAIAGIIIYNNLVSEPREDKASTALAMGQEYLANEQYEKALNGDSTGYAGFIKVADEYSSTDAGNLANLYAGLCYAHLGKWNEAVKYLENYSSADDITVSPNAMSALGDAYANTNQLDKAVDCFKKAAKMADSDAFEGKNNTLSPTYLIKAAEILESQNKKDEALKIYEDIKKNYTNSPLSQEIDKYIERVSAK